MPPSTVIEMEESLCANCGASETTVLFDGEDRLHHVPGRFSVVRCEGCGLMRTNPRPTLASIKAFYPPDYVPYLNTATEPKGRARVLFRRLADSADKTIPDLPPGRLLEIGAASGNFLLQMQRLGWNVTAIEPDAESANRAATRTGAQVICGDVGSVVLPRAEFDLVCGWMVFEHVHDPVAAFTQCLEWLKPGGWLAFSVPDCGSWQFRRFRDDWYALQVPGHLYHFTAPLLQAILSRCGYENIRIRSQRTMIDIPNSLVLVFEGRVSTRLAHWMRVAARSLPVRAASRALGCLAAPLHLTGRITVWAQKPMG